MATLPHTLQTTGMQIAILSDAHDHTRHLQAALAAVGACDALLYCGDLCSPFMVSLLAQGFSKDIHVVFGNNDGDTFRITRNAARFPHVQLHGELYRGQLGGLSFAVNHYPEIGLELARSGRFDVVCYGHDHLAHESREGHTLLLNPGTLMGYNPQPPGGGPPLEVPPTFVLFDTTLQTTAWKQIHIPQGPLPRVDDAARPQARP